MSDEPIKNCPACGARFIKYPCYACNWPTPPATVGTCVRCHEVREVGDVAGQKMCGPCYRDYSGKPPFWIVAVP